jgi:hypothetical protein
MINIVQIVDDSSGVMLNKQLQVVRKIYFTVLLHKKNCFAYDAFVSQSK